MNRSQSWSWSDEKGELWSHSHVHEKKNTGAVSFLRQLRSSVNFNEFSQKFAQTPTKML